MDAGFQAAVNMATMDVACIERVWWKTASNELVVYLIEMPLILSIVLMPLGVFACWDWRFLFALAPYITFRALRWTMERMFPNLFAYRPYFIVSSRGIIIVVPSREPFYLPWSCIVEYSWSSHVGSMTSQMLIQYATANGQVATVVLDGEEKKQPLGELVDILKARIGS
jgi:hypothetical protein